MAKKKKKTARRRSRRRVSGIGKGDIMDVVGIAAGTVAAQYAMSKFGDKLDPKIAAAVQAVGGILLASKGKGLVASLGKGIAVSGVLSGAKEFGMISGIGRAPLVTFDQGSVGYPNMSVISGYNDQNQYMAGMNEMSVISGATENYY